MCKIRKEARQQAVQMSRRRQGKEEPCKAPEVGTYPAGGGKGGLGGCWVSQGERSSRWVVARSYKVLNITLSSLAFVVSNVLTRAVCCFMKADENKSRLRKTGQEALQGSGGWD